jgi:hypothetical protein
MTSDIEAADRNHGCRERRFANAARQPLDGKDVHVTHLFAASLDRG